MLYVLQAPDGRVALLRLADIDQWTTRQHRMEPLVRWRRSGVHGVPLDAIVVVGACSACGAVYEYEAAERLVEGEEIASDRIATPPSQDGGRAVSPWFAPPSDWLERLAREDVGLFPTPRPLVELRDKGHLPRPRFPSDSRAAYDRAAAHVVRVDRELSRLVVATAHD